MYYFRCTRCKWQFENDKPASPHYCCSCGGEMQEVGGPPHHFPVSVPTSHNRQFDTGAQRNPSAGKGRCDLLPFSALLAVSKLYESGGARFGENNWMKGMPQNVFVDSGLRHLMQYARGDTDEDHLVAAAWNILCALDQRERFAAGTLDKALDTIPIKPK